MPQVRKKSGKVKKKFRSGKLEKIKSREKHNFFLQNSIEFAVLLTLNYSQKFSSLAALGMNQSQMTGFAYTIKEILVLTMILFFKIIHFAIILKEICRLFYKKSGEFAKIVRKKCEKGQKVRKK